MTLDRARVLLEPRLVASSKRKLGRDFVQRSAQDAREQRAVGQLERGVDVLSRRVELEQLGFAAGEQTQEPHFGDRAELGLTRKLQGFVRELAGADRLTAVEKGLDSRVDRGEQPAAWCSPA